MTLTASRTTLRKQLRQPADHEAADQQYHEPLLRATEFAQLSQMSLVKQRVTRNIPL